MINKLKQLKNKISIEKIILFTSITFFLSGISVKNPTLVIWASLFLLIHNLVESSKKINDSILFIFFNITFTFFLLSRFFVNGIFGYDKPNYLGLFDFSFNDIKYILHMTNTIYISLLVISLVYFMMEKRNIKQTKKTKNRFIFNNKDFIAILSFIALIIFFVSSLVKSFYLFKEIQFVRTVGYFQSYIIERPFYFKWINLIGTMLYASYYMLLATKPKLKKLILPTAIFIFTSGLELFTGVRNPFMLNVILVIVYFVLRSKIIVFNKKFAITIFITSIFIVILMILIGELRGTRSSNVANDKANGFIAKIFDFLHGQGVSASTIGYTKLYEAEIPKKPYLFGVIINFIKFDILGKFIPKFNLNFFGQTVELATKSLEFQQFITFKIFPYEYLNHGLGLGSSFIAELYHFGGYTSIILGSAFYGYLIYFLREKIKYGSILMSTLAIYMCRDFMFTPRASFTYFLYNILTETQILTIIMIFMMSILIYYLNKKVFKKNIQKIDIA